MRIAQVVPFTWSSHGNDRMTAYHIQPSPSRLTMLSDGTTQGRADALCIQRANERSRSIQSSCRSGHDGSCRELGLVAIDGVLELGLEAAQHLVPAHTTRR